MTATATVVANAAAAEHSVSHYDSLPTLSLILSLSLLVYFGISARPTERTAHGRRTEYLAKLSL